MQQMPEYKDTVSLIPYGLPQFLDFEVPPERTRKIRKTFVERPVLSQANGQKGEAVYLCELGGIIDEESNLLSILLSEMLLSGLEGLVDAPRMAIDGTTMMKLLQS